MKVLIIEDEFLTAQRLDVMLNKYDPQIEVQAILPSVAEAVKWFKQHEDPDLIFMDIHLEDGQSFAIFETINLDTPVIFTTAYDEYMIKAFKVNSVDYLMKPLNFEELSLAIDKFKKFHVQPEASGNIEALMQSIQASQCAYRERFLITAGSRLKPVETSDIRYFYSAEKITFLVTENNQRFPIDYSLDKLAFLLNPKAFFRINRQQIVSLSAIGQIHVYPKGKLKLDLIPDSKEEVFVSMDRVSEFKEWLGK